MNWQPEYDDNAVCAYIFLAVVALIAMVFMSGCSGKYADYRNGEKTYEELNGGY